MTVETQARTTSDIVSDGITEFAITYPFHFASDLRVTHVVGTVVTVLTLDIDWTAVPNDQLTGGTLTLLTGFSEGKIETERRVIAYQSINTTETRTLRAAATERQLDRMVMSFLDAQGQSSALLSRAVVAPHGMPGPVLSELLADGDTLMISGNEIVKGPSASDISLAQAHAEDAADAAASAIAAQAAAEAAADSLDVGNFYSKAEVDALQAAQDAVVAALTLDVADAISDVATISGDVAALEAGSAALDGRLDVLEAHPVIGAWVRFYWNGTSVSVLASKNVSSLVRNGVGDYTVNFSTALVDGNYALAGAVSQINGDFNLVPVFHTDAGSGYRPGSYATASACRVGLENRAGGYNDPYYEACLIFVR